MPSRYGGYSTLELARRAGEAEQRRIDQSNANQQVEAIQARIANLTKEHAIMSNAHIDAIRQQTAANINNGAPPPVAEERAVTAYTHLNPDWKIDEATFEGLSSTLQAEYASRFRTPQAAQDMFLDGPETDSMRRERQVQGRFTPEESQAILDRQQAKFDAAAEAKVVAARDAAVTALANAQGIPVAEADALVAPLDTFRKPADKPKSEVQVLKDTLHGMSHADMGIVRAEAE